MSKQPIIGKIQNWLNTTYKNSPGFSTISVTEEPGWETTNAMLIAYQIEDGVSQGIIEKEKSSGIYDFTGEGFSPLSASTDFSIKSNQNRLMILQGAFYLKGINPGSFGPVFNSEMTTAIETLQANAGIGATGIADLLVVKALLSMDQFVVLSQYGGKEAIADIQKALNARFAEDMNGLIPSDGIYGRELNKALIYALQITEGLSAADANEADGYFGPGTQQRIPILNDGDGGYAVTLLQYALYVNGYTGVDFSETYDSNTVSAVSAFERAVGLSQNGGTHVGLDIWMGLLLSSGNANREVHGCDAAQSLSYEDAVMLKNNGYDIVGRYLVGNFATTTQELTDILKAGMNVFPIYETGSYETSYFSPEQGTSDAVDAVQACRKFGIPEQTRIYFTVDYDMEGYQIENLVIPYFKAIFEKFNSSELQYNIGIYGSRNVCEEVISAGYAQLAFVDGASTGYSGNMGYPMPKEWAFNQIKEGVNIGSVQIDHDQVSGLDNGFSSITNETGITKNTMLPDTGLSTTDAEVARVVNNSLTSLLTNIMSIKGPEILDFCEVDKEKLFLKGGPFYFANDNAYLKYDSGIKPLLGSGGDLNMYFNVDSATLDVLSNNKGSNINPSILLDKDKDLQTKLLSLMPTGVSGNAQFYSCWNANEDAEPGYIEIGMEYGIPIPAIKNKELTDNGKLKEVNSLEGAYIFVDIIIGIKKNLLEKEYELALDISKEFALRMFADISSAVVKSIDKTIQIIDGTLSIVLKEIPVIIEVIELGTIAGILVALGVSIVGALG